jgi:hypothetical protein
VQPSDKNISLIIFLFGESYETHRRFSCFVRLPLHTGKLRQLAVFFYEEQVYDICVSNLFNSNILSLKKKIKTCFPILLLLPLTLRNLKSAKTYYVLTMLAPAFVRTRYGWYCYIGKTNTCNFISFVRKLSEGFYRL